jgi:hypothetical protein
MRETQENPDSASASNRQLTRTERRSRRMLVALAVVVALVAIRFTWQPGLGSLYDDSVSYLIMAQVYSPWQSPSAAVAAAYTAERYPPLFPALLALVGAGSNWYLAHAIVAISLAFCVFLFGMFARAVLDSWAWGLVVAGVFACMPGVWLNVGEILSEFPYTALTISALLFYAAWRRRIGWRRSLMLGVLIAACMLTRTIGVALLIAFALVESLTWLGSRDGRRLRHAALAAATALSCVAVWFKLRPLHAEDPYVSEWTAKIVLANLSTFVDAWLAAVLVLWHEPYKPTFIIASVIGICGVIGTVRRAWSLQLDAVYTLVFFGILALWPYPGQMYRLTLPVLMFLMLNAFWLWRRLFLRWNGGISADRLLAYATIAPVACCLPATLLHFLPRATLPCDGAVAGYCVTDIAELYRIPVLAAAKTEAQREIDVVTDFARIRRTTDAAARVMWHVPGYVALLAEREGVEMPEPVDAASLAARLRQSHPDYIYLSLVHPRDTAHRRGDPMAALPVVLTFADVVWLRNGPAGVPEAALLKVDYDRVPPPS